MRPFAFKKLNNNNFIAAASLAALLIATPSMAQNALPAGAEQSLQDACNVGSINDESNPAATENAINEAAERCAGAAGGLAADAETPAEVEAIAARAVEIGPDTTGAILAETLAEQSPDSIADIINAMVAVRPEQAAEFILAAAGSFPEQDQEIVLGQLVATVSEANPDAIDPSAFAAIFESLPFVGQAATGLTGLDLVSPN